MRRFPGVFLNFDSKSIPIPQERYAPSIEIRVRWNDREVLADFLVDTGAESSVLYPTHAEQLFGMALEELDFRTPAVERVTSIDGLVSLAVRVPVTMTLFDEFDVPLSFDTTMLVVRPNPLNLDDPDADRGNWDTPSLLGRDLLLSFDLHVSGSRSEVYLALPD